MSRSAVRSRPSSGVFAAGDRMRRQKQLVFAAADGASAAMSANKNPLVEAWKAPAGR